MPLDRYDAAILDALQKDGRKPIVELAEQVGLSNTPCAPREAAGAGRHHPGLYGDHRSRAAGAEGAGVRAGTPDAAHRREHRAVPARRRRDGEIVSCHAMTGNYDLLLQVVVPDLESLSNVVLKKLLRIRFVRDVHSSIVLNTIKRSARVPVRHLVMSRLQPDLTRPRPPAAA